MARLPWQHTRSRTRSGNEKTIFNNTPDWFSRTTAEPSRQALTDLVTAHNRGKSNDSNITGLRSRTNTGTSTRSQRSQPQPGSSEEESWSRPSSQGASDDPSEASRKSLLSKSSRILRRPSSRMSLSSGGSTSTPGLSSPSRSSRVSNAATRADDIRSRISAPFDFQHITHTEETQFSGLRRIEESALADQYTAAISEQHPAPRLRGISTSDLEPTKHDKQLHAVNSDNEARTPSVSSAELPQTPPRPPPPPKDNVTSDVQDLGSTGLMWLAAHDNNVADTAHIRDGCDQAALESKPLPELPELPELPVIHAITTEDNTAMAMPAEPLPTPPLSTSSTGDLHSISRIHHQRQFSAAHVRRPSLHPSAKASMPNLLATNNMLAAPRALSRHHSDMALSQQTKTPFVTASTRTSMSFAAIDTLNWEDAVDEAWDIVDAEDGDISSGSFLSICSDNAQADVAYSVPSPATESAASTPLMIMAPCAPPRSPDRPILPHALEIHQLESVKEDEPGVEVAGLGISSCPTAAPPQPASRLSRSSSVHFPRRRSSLSYQGNETLTRSSSQESIIFSIASSIFGTQRSSNSSMSAVDMANGCVVQLRDSAPGAYEYDEGQEREEVSRGAARPESGCLPLDILEQITSFGATFSTDQVSTTDGATPVPSLPFQGCRQSAPKLLVPERRSSVVATIQSGTHRQRSSTWVCRPRQSSNVSYSLFPTAQQPSATATTTP